MYTPTPEDQLIGTQRKNTVNLDYEENQRGQVKGNEDGALGVNFEIKFIDANSNSNINEDNTTNINDAESDDDALPAGVATAGGTAGPSDYITGGGPDIDSIPTVTTDNDSIKLENGNDSNIISHGGVSITVNAKANDKKLKQMESRLNTLGEKMLGLMERIQDLTDRNQQLELSKLELITNTSNAMNEYRETIKRLSETNNILLTKITLR